MIYNMAHTSQCYMDSRELHNGQPSVAQERPRVLQEKKGYGT